MNSQKGFTLLELMLVVSIIAILSLIALPSYQIYIKRARFSEVIAATTPFKIAISIALQEGASLSDLSNGKSGIPETIKSTKNLADITVRKGIITATATKLVDGLTIILKPNEDGSDWQISGSCQKIGFCSE